VRVEDISLPIWRQWHQTSGLGSRNDYVPFRDGFGAGVNWAIRNPERAASLASSKAPNQRADLVTSGQATKSLETKTADAPACNSDARLAQGRI
jgi:hypothetical protein